MGAAWHFFVSNGGVRALITIGVGVIVGGILRGLLKAILRELRAIADYLDTHTAGGLHDVVRALEGRKESDGRPGHADR